MRHENPERTTLDRDGVRARIRWPRRLVSTGVAACALLAGAVVSPAAAQAHDPWGPWLGCWVPVGATQDGAVCFVRTADGVDAVTLAGTAVEDRVPVRADGSDRPVRRSGCEGTEALRFSEDGRRLYTASRQTCEDGVAHAATGIMALVTPTQWIDIRSDGSTLQPVTSIRYYQLARPELAASAGLPTPVDDARQARLAASLPPTLDDVVDASRHVSPAAIEAWVVETAEPFDLDGGALVAMADGGVADRVIDIVVAVSFPDQFQVDREGVPHEVLAQDEESGSGGGGYIGVPWGWIPPGYGYGGYYGIYFSPAGWAYGGYGGWTGGYYPGYRPISIEVTPTPSRTSRVVNGKGYTRNRGSSGGGSPSTAPPRRDDVNRSSGNEGGTSSQRAEPATRKAKRRGGG